MATEGQIWQLREMVGEPDDANGWTDERLAAFIDGQETLTGAVSQVWYSKAASYSELVDVSESGSSRKLSDLHRNALAMGDKFANPTEESGSAATGPVIQRIRRGFS